MSHTVSDADILSMAAMTVRANMMRANKVSKSARRMQRFPAVSARSGVKLLRITGRNASSFGVFDRFMIATN
jgi:hypothetical protein